MKEITFYEIKQLMLETLQSIRYELSRRQRPAEEIILGDEEVIKLLGISKRKLYSMKASRLIPYHRPEGQSKSFYRLSDILEWLKKWRVESIDTMRRI